MKEKKLTKHVVITATIGITFSILGLLLGLRKMEAGIMLGILPMFCIIMFIIKRSPGYVIAYTVLFVLNRLSIMLKRTLLAKVMVLALIAYFVYVDYIFWKAREEQKRATN